MQIVSGTYSLFLYMFIAIDVILIYSIWYIYFFHIQRLITIMQLCINSELNSINHSYEIWITMSCVINVLINIIERNYTAMQLQCHNRQIMIQSCNGYIQFISLCHDQLCKYTLYLQSWIADSDNDVLLIYSIWYILSYSTVI